MKMDFSLLKPFLTKTTMANQEDVNNLRRSVLEYRDIDNRVRDLNRQIGPLREQRKIIELQIVDVLRQPEFATYQKLDIREDGSSIRISRPGQWSGAWSLSKGRLNDLIGQYFASTAAPTADGCYEYCVRTQNILLRKNEFAIERFVSTNE